MQWNVWQKRSKCILGEPINMKAFTTFSCLIFLYLLTSCNSAEENQFTNGKKIEISERDQLLNEELNRFNQEVNAPDAIGLRGIYSIPEMLSLVIQDSAPAHLVAERRALAYAAIEEDINYVGAQIDGSPGSIYYNNDPKNFKFECLMLIREMPKKTPKNSKVVVLESGSMLVYNHKGNFRSLYEAYSKIKHYNDSCNLEQSGPMREFYIVSPIDTPDSNLWLTRIMVPVNKKN